MIQRSDGEKFKYSDIDYLDTWRAMEEYVKLKKIRSIGLSNFNHKQILRVINNCTIKPAVLQASVKLLFSFQLELTNNIQSCNVKRVFNRKSWIYEI